MPKPAEFIEPSLAEPEKHQAFLMYCIGFGAAEIEAKTGVRADLIRQWAHRERWNETRTQYENLLREKNPIKEQPIVKSVIRAKKGERRKEYEELTGKMAVDNAKHWADEMTADKRLSVAPAIAALGGFDRKNLGMDEEAEAGEKSHISLTFLTQADSPGFVKIIEPAKVKEIEDEK